MGREVVKTQLGAFVFDIAPMPPQDALKVMTRLTKLGGESFGTLLGGLGAQVGSKQNVKLADLQVDGDIFPKAVSMFVSRLDENEVIETIKILLKPVFMQDLEAGDKGTRTIFFEKDFTGRLGLLMQVLVECLKVNYGDFFDANSGIGSILRRVRPPMTTDIQT